jgi:hypothetical protein
MIPTVTRIDDTTWAKAQKRATISAHATQGDLIISRLARLRGTVAMADRGAAYANLAGVVFPVGRLAFRVRLGLTCATHSRTPMLRFMLALAADGCGHSEKAMVEG